MRLVKFDQHECIDLLSLLKIMGSMSQEQIWAIFYFTAQQLNSKHEQRRRKKRRRKQETYQQQNSNKKQAELATTNNHCELPFKPIDGLSHIYIHKLGFVNAKTRAFWRHMFAGEQLDGSEIERDINDHDHNEDDDDDDDYNDDAVVVVDHDECNNKQQRLELSNTTSSSQVCSDLSNSSKTAPNYLMMICDEEEEEEEESDDASSDEEADYEELAAERRLVSNLCLAIYLALDYGIADDEERKIDANLEQLIYASQLEDENEGQPLSLTQVKQTCIERVKPTATQISSVKSSQSIVLVATKHYATVLKSLVDDCVQLSNFLHKIYKASVSLNDANLSYLEDRTAGAVGGQSVGELANCNVEELRRLGLSVEPLGSKLESINFNSWARLWMHVIRELRQRVQQKQLAAVSKANDGKSSTSSSLHTDDDFDEDDDEEVDIEIDEDEDDDDVETSSASTSTTNTTAAAIHRKIATQVSNARAAKSGELLQLAAH